MQIERFSAFRFRLPLREPIRVTGGITLTSREGVLIRLEAIDGAVGWGEASPLPGFSSESLEDVLDSLPVLRSEVEGAEVEMRPPLPERVAGVFLAAPSLDFALAGAAAALVRTAGRDRHARRYLDHTAGSAPVRATVPVARLLQGPPPEIAERAREAAALGYRCVKVKVGRVAVEEEAAMVGEVRQAVGPDVAIRLDANRSWTAADASRFWACIQQFSIDFVEEPLESSGSIEELVRDTGMPVALDESVRDQVELVDRGIVVAAILKPTVLGATAAREIVSRCRAANARPVFSGSYESGIGTLGVLMMAASTPEHTVAAGLGTHSHLAGDVLQTQVAFDRPVVDVAAALAGAAQVNMSILEPLRI